MVVKSTSCLPLSGPSASIPVEPAIRSSARLCTSTARFNRTTPGSCGSRSTTSWVKTAACCHSCNVNAVGLVQPQINITWLDHFCFLIHFLPHEANRGLVTHSRNRCAVPDFWCVISKFSGCYFSLRKIITIFCYG